MRGKLLKIISIIFIFLLVKSAGAKIFKHINVRIFSPEYLEAPMILTGVDAARVWFYKKTGESYNDLEVFVVVADSDGDNRFGYFDKRFIFIKPYDEKYVYFKQKTDRILYSMFVLHEASHYLLYYHTDGYWDIPGLEYLAWVMFFEMLPQKYLDKILKEYEKDFTPFDNRTQINKNFLYLSGEIFAIKSYAHHLEDNGKLLKEILNGEFKSYTMPKYEIPKPRDFIIPQPGLTKNKQKGEVNGSKDKFEFRTI